MEAGSRTDQGVHAGLREFRSQAARNGRLCEGTSRWAPESNPCLCASQPHVSRYKSHAKRKWLRCLAGHRLAQAAPAPIMCHGNHRGPSLAGPLALSVLESSAAAAAARLSMLADGGGSPQTRPHVAAVYTGGRVGPVSTLTAWCVARQPAPRRRRRRTSASSAPASWALPW